MSYYLNTDEEEEPQNDSGKAEYEEWYFSEEQQLERINVKLRIYSSIFYV